MFNQNQNIYTEIGNPQSALQQEPNYGQPINLPSSVQINNPELFTGLYWMGRWTLQNLVQGDPYFTPSWNILGSNNFENQDYAKCVARMCDALQRRNTNDLQNDIVMPLLEMDAAVRWCDNPQVAEQVLPPQYQKRALDWKARADQLMAQSNVGGGFPQQGGFGRQSNGFNQPAQQNVWQQQRSGGFQAPSKSWGGQQQVSGTNKSGFFNDNAQAPVSSRNAAGIRTTTSALAQHSAPKAQQSVASDEWKPRSAAATGWNSASIDETQKTVGENPLDALLPQKSSGEWPVQTNTPEQTNTGTTTMPHEVKVDTPVTSNEVGLRTDGIKCPVLSPVALAVFGEFLPKVAIITGKGNADNVLVLPHGQTDLDVVNLNSKEDSRLGYDSGSILVDYIWADYERQEIVSKTVPVKRGETNVDYASHTLSGPVAPVHPKHVVIAAAMTKPAEKVSDEGIVTSHRGKTIDSSRATYSTAETHEFIAASIRAQNQDSVDKSIETYDKFITPFVMVEGFDTAIFDTMHELNADGFDAYVEQLNTLPRTMQLHVSAHILKDVRFALDVTLDADLNISDFDDIGDITDYLRSNRSDKLAGLWTEELSRIMRNNIYVTPEALREDAIKALGDAIPKTTDNLVLLERSRYELTLPYTLSELNIAATDDAMFYVRDTTHADLHEAVQAIFARLTKTEISDFTLRLADGITYQIGKLATVAKTYVFSKVA